MPGKNKIIKLNSISRHTVDEQPCILLDNQQDLLGQVHSLALIPVVQKVTPDGSKNISFPNNGFHLLSPVKVGLFPISFQMLSQYGYLVLGIVPKDVIPDFTPNGHSPSLLSTALNGSTQACERDQQMAREWIVAHKVWVQTNGLIIYA